MGASQSVQEELVKAVRRGGATHIKNYLDQAQPGDVSRALNATDEQGRTLLHLAVEKGWMNVVALLLGAGGDPRVLNYEACSPGSSKFASALHSAAYQGRLDLAQLLLQHGADPFIASPATNRTPADEVMGLGDPVTASKLLGMFEDQALYHGEIGIKHSKLMGSVYKQRCVVIVPQRYPVVPHARSCEEPLSPRGGKASPQQRYCAQLWIFRSRAGSGGGALDQIKPTGVPICRVWLDTSCSVRLDGTQGTLRVPRLHQGLTGSVYTSQEHGATCLHLRPSDLKPQSVDTYQQLMAVIQTVCSGQHPATRDVSLPEPLPCLYSAGGVSCSSGTPPIPIPAGLPGCDSPFSDPNSPRGPWGLSPAHHAPLSPLQANLQGLLNRRAAQELAMAAAAAPAQAQLRRGRRGSVDVGSTSRRFTEQEQELPPKPSGRRTSVDAAVLVFSALALAPGKQQQQQQQQQHAQEPWAYAPAPAPVAAPRPRPPALQIESAASEPVAVYPSLSATMPSKTGSYPDLCPALSQYGDAADPYAAARAQYDCPWAPAAPSPGAISAPPAGTRPSSSNWDSSYVLARAASQEPAHQQPQRAGSAFSQYSAPQPVSSDLSSTAASTAASGADYGDGYVMATALWTDPCGAQSAASALLQQRRHHSAVGGGMLGGYGGAGAGSGGSAAQLSSAASAVHAYGLHKPSPVSPYGPQSGLASPLPYGGPASGLASPTPTPYGPRSGAVSPSPYGPNSGTIASPYGPHSGTAVPQYGYPAQKQQQADSNSTSLPWIGALGQDQQQPPQQSPQLQQRSPTPSYPQAWPAPAPTAYPAHEDFYASPSPYHTGPLSSEVAQQCIICMDAPQTVGFLHGGSVHSAACRRCAPAVRVGGPCPLCRQPVERVVALFK